MLAKTAFIFGLIVLSNARSIHRYELGERYYYLKALKQQEAAARRFSNYYRPADNYNFGYSVHDRFTDADGYRRGVDYNADDVRGFNAFVRRVPVATSRFGGPFRTPASTAFGTAAPPFGPVLGTAAPPTYHLGSNVNKFYPIVNNDISNYVSDYFNGYSEGSFDQFY